MKTIYYHGNKYPVIEESAHYVIYDAGLGVASAAHKASITPLAQRVILESMLVAARDKMIRCQEEVDRLEAELAEREEENGDV